MTYESRAGFSQKYFCSYLQNKVLSFQVRVRTMTRGPFSTATGLPSHKSCSWLQSTTLPSQMQTFHGDMLFPVPTSNLPNLTMTIASCHTASTRSWTELKSQKRKQRRLRSRQDSNLPAQSGKRSASGVLLPLSSATSARQQRGEI